MSCYEPSCELHEQDQRPEGRGSPGYHTGNDRAVDRHPNILYGSDNPADVIVEGGYIRVMQDVRGKYRSAGDNVMNRPLRGPQSATRVDHSTHTYDTIDWLVKNVPQSNGKVGIVGISYDGFLALMALVNPHPALKVAIPMNPQRIVYSPQNHPFRRRASIS
jgi:putative CocE/NonD family hydrolase